MGGIEGGFLDGLFFGFFMKMMKFFFSLFS